MKMKFYIRILKYWLRIPNCVATFLWTRKKLKLDIRGILG
jgi:hypothetical protein